MTLNVRRAVQGAAPPQLQSTAPPAHGHVAASGWQGFRLRRNKIFREEADG